MGGGPVIVYWRGVTADPESALCWEAAAKDPALHDILVRPISGFGSYRTNTASGGTDNGGGHVDINCVGLTVEQCRRLETTYRRYGNAAYWRPERRPDGTRYGWQNHLHVIRMDCADLSSGARTQVNDYLLGWNGLPIGGRITRDSGDRSYTSRRWLAVKKTLATITEEWDMASSDYISEQIKAVGGDVDYVQKQVKAVATQLTGAQAALASAIQAIGTAMGPTVEAAVKEALKDAVVDVNVNFPAEPEV